jgi:hypothetical protein
VICERLRAGQTAVDATNESLELLGTEGLRTLMVAHRVMEKTYFDDWLDRYAAASRLIDGRKVGTTQRERDFLCFLIHFFMFLFFYLFCLLIQSFLSFNQLISFNLISVF